MALKDLHLKLTAIRLRRFFLGDGKRKRRVSGIKKNHSWMNPISHGYYTIDQSTSPRDCSTNHGSQDSDLVLVQREQIEDLELWFFEVSDAQIRDGIAKYMQTHLFYKKPNTACSSSEIRRKGKETMRKAYLAAKAKIREEKWQIAGSASVMVIDGEKIVMANMGDYRVVICKDGDAHQISNRHQKTLKRHWSRRMFLVCNYGDLGEAENPKSSELAVGVEKINSDSEFVILASSGVWEVMKNQEAVNLIRHIEDPQQAAQCLAKEAFIRMSKSCISCIVIRFD